MSDLQEQERPAVEHTRVQLLKDVAVFQGKLMIDGVRDLLMVPISLFAAVIDLFSSDKPKGRHFYQTVHLGKRTETYIDLFAAAERSPFESPLQDDEEHQRLDDLVERVESVVKEQYADGGLSGTARRALNKALDSMADDRRRHPGDQGD